MQLAWFKTLGISLAKIKIKRDISLFLKIFCNSSTCLTNLVISWGWLLLDFLLFLVNQGFYVHSPTRTCRMGDWGWGDLKDLTHWTINLKAAEQWTVKVSLFFAPYAVLNQHSQMLTGKCPNQICHRGGLLLFEFLLHHVCYFDLVNAIKHKAKFSIFWLNKMAKPNSYISNLPTISSNNLP